VILSGRDSHLFHFSQGIIVVHEHSLIFQGDFAWQNKQHGNEIKTMALCAKAQRAIQDSG
jgi:hypothetical protein